MEAMVEYEYEAEQDDELTLKVGDVIKNVVIAEGGWWEGELAGKKGMFPDNFVKLRNKAAPKEEKREAPQRKSVRELANKFKDGVPLPGAQAPVMQKRKEAVKMKKCKVMFDYKGENEDELDLTVGQIVDFIKEVEEGWWEGSLDGKIGVFPSNFVEMIEEGGEGGQSAEGSRPASGETDGEFHEIKGKKVMGVGLGNIFQGGPIQLRSTAKKSKPEEKDSREAKPLPPQPPDVSKREKHSTVERAVARFSYEAEQPDELTLREGDIVRVMDKQLEDEGWWRGEVNGKVGVFPDNFVELLPPQEEPSKAPQKPPPPVAKNIYPKLPEKSLSVEEKPPVAKKESDAVTDKPLPAGNVKKPMFPPPVGKKPGITQKAAEPPSKPEPLKPAEPAAKVELRHREPVSNHKTAAPESNHVEAGGDSNLDAVESSSHKLVHLTASRAKAPKTRPPSTVIFPADIDKESVDAEESMKGTNHVQPQKPPPPVAREAKHTPPPEVDRSHRQPSPHDTSLGHPQRDAYDLQSSHAAIPPPRPPEPSRHHDSASEVPALTRLVDNLQREVQELRQQTVTKNEYNDLRSDYQRLKQEFEAFKATQSKKLVDLMMEVDEEKKLRLNTQVEMERVKKMVAETHV